MEEHKRFSFFDKEELKRPEITVKSEAATPVTEQTVQSAKYRCEQTVVTQINGVVANHAETKREFAVELIHSNSKTTVSVVLTDNIISFSPQQLQDAISMLCEVDNVKCKVNILVDRSTGKIKAILNHEDIITRWNNYKDELNRKYSFLREETTRQNLQSFISLAEAQILNEPLLIADLQTKLFFDVFFDSYLVQNDIAIKPYTRTFYSQLFEAQPVNLLMHPFIMNETPDTVTISKTGKMDKEKLNVNSIQKMYDERYKPVVQYKFSEFNFSYAEKTVLNTKENLIETTQINIQEEVKNNVLVVISYSLKKVQ